MKANLYPIWRKRVLRLTALHDSTIRKLALTPSTLQNMLPKIRHLVQLKKTYTSIFFISSSLTRFHYCQFLHVFFS